MPGFLDFTKGPFNQGILSSGVFQNGMPPRYLNPNPQSQAPQAPQALPVNNSTPTINSWSSTGDPDFRKYVAPWEDSPGKGSRDVMLEDARGWGVENLGPWIRTNSGDPYGVLDQTAVANYQNALKEAEANWKYIPGSEHTMGSAAWQFDPNSVQFTDFTPQQLQSYLSRQYDEAIKAGNPGNDAMWLPKYTEYGGNPYVQYGQRLSKKGGFLDAISDFMPMGIAALASAGIASGFGGALGASGAAAGVGAAEGLGLPSIWGSSLPFGSSELGIAGTGGGLANIASQYGSRLPTLASLTDSESPQPYFNPFGSAMNFNVGGLNLYNMANSASSLNSSPSLFGGLPGVYGTPWSTGPNGTSHALPIWR